MPSETVKIGVSLPKEKFSAVEKMRRKFKKTRSALIAEAISLWIQEKKEEELVRQYVAGYKKHPETKKEREEALKISQEVLESEEWDE
jgi:metal-responsive CopG/Arc/MetJ family transcriptional regulator